MDKYLALLLAAMLLVEAVVSAYGLCAANSPIVTPPASLLDWVLDVRLKRERSRTSF